MTEESTPRPIVLRMEPIIRDLSNGIDAAVALALSPHYGQPKSNGPFFVAEALELSVRRLRESWRELDAATEGQPTLPPLKAVGDGGPGP